MNVTAKTIFVLLECYNIIILTHTLLLKENDNQLFILILIIIQIRGCLNINKNLDAIDW